MLDEITVHSPATVANVASGFDILGFALEHPCDVITVKKRSERGVRIVNETEGFPNMPTDPSRNTAGVALLAMLASLKSDVGFELTFHEKIRPGSGVGSSAASAVAGIVGANALLGNPYSRTELLPFAMEGERLACGVAHADNVGPALLGGFVLVRSYHPLEVVTIDCPDDLHGSVVHPQIEVRTEDARNILRKEILLRDAITQWGNTAGLIAGLMKKDYGLIGRSLQDVIIEPVRSILIPAFKEVKEAAMAVGALGCSISGSGPSIFALSQGRETAQKAADQMQEAFDRIGIPSSTYVSAINKQGAHLTSSKP